MICLALIFMFTLSVFAVMTHLISATTGPILSIVPTGDTGATSTTDFPTQALGTTLTADVRLDDYASVTEGGPSPGVSACTYAITWNPNVLSYTSETDGSWLPGQLSSDILPPSRLGNGELSINQIDGASYATADNSAGSVTATIVFTVVGTGGTALTLQYSSSLITYYLQAPNAADDNSVPVPDVTTVNAQYGSVSTPTVSIAPASAIADVSQSTLFTATASGGSAPYTGYQWYVGETAQSGQVASTFSFDPSSAGTYSITATVTDSTPTISAPSTASSVTVNTAPTVSIAPAGPLTLTVGESQTFTATPSGGSGTISYQWYFGDSAISGATSSTYSFSESTAGSYSIICKVTDSATTPVTSPASNTVSITVSTTTPTPTPTPSTTPTPTTTPAPSSTPSPTPTPTPFATPTPTPSPTPTGPTHGPTAVISITNGTTYATGDYIVLAGSSSTPGYDAQSVKSCPITNYAWLVQYENASEFGAYSGSGVTFTVSSVGWLQITLIVTAPDVNTSPNPQYTNTSLASVWINVQSPLTLTKIDVFNNKGGIGPDVASGPFGPQELVQLCAYVTYNSGFVVNGNVAFTVISPNDTVIAVRSDLTNSTGYAAVNYETPNVGSSNFGIWTVIAAVEVNQVVVTDKVTFEYNYLVNVIANGLKVPASAARGSPMTISVSIQNLENITLTSTLTITIYDQNDVPIYTSITNNINAADGATVKVTFTVPTYAFVGEATVYVNILTANPTSGGVPLCPETTANFQILS